MEQQLFIQELKETNKKLNNVYENFVYNDQSISVHGILKLHLCDYML